MQDQSQLKAIGFRVERDSICFSLVTGGISKPVLLFHRKLKSPAIYDNDEAARLNWFRSQVLDVLKEHRPQRAMVRFPETSGPAKATNSARERSRIEGVILQLLSENRIEVLTGALSTIASCLNLTASSAKKELENESFRELIWSKYSVSAKESIITAVAALKE